MKTRVLTALILIPIVLVIMMSASPWPLFAFAALLGGAAYKELSTFGALEKTGFPVWPVIVIIAGVWYAISEPGIDPVLSLFVLSILGLIMAPIFVGKPSKIRLELASLWCICPLLILGAMQGNYHLGGSWWNTKSPILLVVLPIWIGDSLAYFVGRKFGRHLLSPRISPKKTVEGGIANLLGCIGGALAVGAWVGAPMWVSAACGLIGGTFGQAGDLFESGLKRAAGVKDAGSLLPGHGGVLDRIDSLLLAAPLEALLLVGFWPVQTGR